MNKLCGIKKTAVIIFIATCVNISEAQLEFGDKTKIEESNVKQGRTTLGAISSRFLDLGGVISQLFSGFNQGNRGGGGPGLNLPPNSQFYPAVPAQNSYSKPSISKGNNWSLSEQQNNGGNTKLNYNPAGQIENIRWNQINENSNYNSIPHHYQEWPQEGQNSKNQDIQNQQYQTTRGWTNTNWSNQGEKAIEGQKSLRNEGTLDDFITTQRSNVQNQFYKDQSDLILFPDRDNSKEFSTKNAIWGKLVPVPSSTSSDNIVFIDSSESPSQKLCVQNCPTSSEYNPVCGTDDVSYFNPGRLICARNCGIHVFEARQGKCRSRG